MSAGWLQMKVFIDNMPKMAIVRNDMAEPFVFHGDITEVTLPTKAVSSVMLVGSENPKFG